MTEQRDGILDPEDAEEVELPPELEAVKQYAANPTAETWSAARDALAPPAAHDELEAAMHRYALATDDDARERAREELFALVANRQPIDTTTWGELGTAPPREWLVKGWLPTGCVTILSILDPLAAAWVGNENDRSLVRAFMSSWDAWSREGTRAVLVLAHEPKSRERGPASSTDWEAAARAVWTLGKEPFGPELKGSGSRKPQNDRPLEWKLELTKTNYSEPEALKMSVDTQPGVDHKGNKWRWRIYGPWEDNYVAAS